jgi:predicted aconitase
MRLTRGENSLLSGERGPVLQKVMRTLVRYGELLEAERFVEIEGPGHFAIHHVLPGIGPRLEMLDELAQAGLCTPYPFTLDPRPPLDFVNLGLSHEQVKVFQEMFRGQDHFDRRMQQLGLRDREAYTCTPYLTEVGNIPQRGAILAWSESSAVVFANSVLGARTNRNAVILDLLSNLVGKTPLTGLLTDEGRRATWLVEVKTATLPHPQLLGGVVGRRVMEDVPYILGLDCFLGKGLNDRSRDYLKEMGAACAAIGAVGLFHADGITPEAEEQGGSLLDLEHRTYVVDETELQAFRDASPVLWPSKEAMPRKCLIGCPHLSLRELYWWADHIREALRAEDRDTVAVHTVLCAAPQVLQAFKADREIYPQLRQAGVRLSGTCAEAYMDNPLCAEEPVVTNSCKLSAFTTARMFPDEELLGVIVSGDVRHE